MCGIAGIYIKDPSVVKVHAGLERMVNELYCGIESRGRQATGLVAVDRNGKATIDKAPKTASEFIRDREKLPQDMWYCLLHTRFATKGPIEDHRNNHPVISGTCLTTHNGSVSNDDDLFEKYKLPRAAEVDTEIIPALIGMADFDIEKISDIFQHVEGSVASATIDPIKHPGKVLLLRTKGTPLQIIETPKFVVWASEAKPIRDAWGRVLGTPPTFKRIKYVAEYTAIELTQEGSTVHGLKRPKIVSSGWTVGGSAGKDAKQHSNTPAKSTTPANEHPLNANHGGWSSLVTAAEVKAAVAAARLRNEGLAHVRGITGVVGTRWEFCNICQEFVKPEDHINTLQRGRMCLDCSHWWNALYRAKASIDAIDVEAIGESDSGIPAHFDVSKYVSLHKINELSLWAEDEDFVHISVIDELAEATGINAEALNFLMFRSDVEDWKDNPDVSDLLTILWDMYDTAYDYYWHKHDEKAQKDYRRILAKSKELVVVRRGEDREKAPLIVNGSADKRPKKCLFCNKKKTKRIVAPDAGTEFGFCNKHWETCSVKGCGSHATHTRRDAIRVCHTHARSVKGCHADKVLMEKGYVMEAVK